MKKVIALLCLTAVGSSFAYNRDYLLYKIIDSDYHLFTKALGDEALSAQDPQSFSEINEEIISVRKKLVASHSFAPQIGKELVGSLAAGFLTFLGLGFTEASLTQPSQCPMATFLFSAGLTASAAFCSLKLFVDAFQKPKVLLANALRIQDILNRA